MESKELRIGNYINVYDGLRPDKLSMAKVVNVYGEEELLGCLVKLLDESVHASMHEKLISPIPLTEEWLLKLGFSKMTIKPLWRKTIGEYTLESEDFLFDFKSKHVYADSGLTLHPIGNETKYVHQLQNLYSALTGQELTLTPAKEMK